MNFNIKRLRETLTTPAEGLQQGRDKLVRTVVCDNRARTDPLVRGLRTVLHLHGAQPHIIDDMDRQVHRYLDVNGSEKEWVDRAKYLLILPMAEFLARGCAANDLPPAPPGSALAYESLFGAWYRNRIRLAKSKNGHLWYSWLQCKRCCLPASESLVESTYEKHFKALTKPDPLTLGEAEHLIESTPAFMEILENAATDVASFFLSDTMKVRLPNDAPLVSAAVRYSASTSACFESTRATGGLSGELYRRAFEEPVAFDTELYSMQYSFSMKKFCWEVVEYRGSPEQVAIASLGKSLSGQDASRWVDMLRVEHANEIGSDRRSRAIIQAVIEPLKVRVISKGPAGLYHLVKPVQKAMWNALQRYPCFSLTGNPITVDMVSRIAGYGGDHWLSVDYSAATDGLSSNLGMSILRRLLSKLPDETAALCSRALGHHHLWYPEYKGKDGADAWRRKMVTDAHCTFEGTQTNGQLMGSLMSFPVLCLANLLVYMRVHPGQSAGESVQRVLVNGDDMLYKGSVSDWIAHKEVSSSVGLLMSPGKAYIHPHYSNANSTGFWETLDRIRPVPFINCGLLYGNHKVVKCADEKELYVANIGAVMSGAYDEQMARAVLKMYLGLHGRVLKEETAAILHLNHERVEFTRNLFLPQSLGGMGVPCPSGFQFMVTDYQKLVAIYLADRANRAGPFDIVAPGRFRQVCFAAESTLPIQWPTASDAEHSIPHMDADAGRIRARWRELGIWRDGFVTIPHRGAKCHE